jgi:hypothetical protein
MIWRYFGTLADDSRFKILFSVDKNEGAESFLKQYLG